MSEFPEVETLGKLMALAAKYGAQELEVEEGGVRIAVRAEDSSMLGEPEPEAVGNGYLWRPPILMDARPDAATSTRPSSAEPLTAPLTGVFYRAASEDQPPFVEVGHTVEKGQTIGLLEAMKVFSEIEADRSGVVVEIVVQNGKMVQHGDVLMYIDPAAAL